MHTSSLFPLNNRLLAAVPPDELGRLLPKLSRVHLPRGRLIYNVGDTVRYVYFPASGMCSLLAATEGGALLEVGVVGTDGLVGLPAVLRGGVTRHEVMAQLDTNAFRISAESLRAAVACGGVLQEVLLRYAYTLFVQVSQTALCNRFHTIRQRLCRWLLISLDATGSDTVHLTQEFLSYMLGVPRTGVTLAAGDLQKAGLISYRRGRIKALDRARLERAACECYRVTHAEVRRAITA